MTRLLKAYGAAGKHKRGRRRTKMGGREEGREGGRADGREGGREGEREGGREGGRTRKRPYPLATATQMSLTSVGIAFYVRMSREE
jgi:hypothetical protein